MIVYLRRHPSQIPCQGVGSFIRPLSGPVIVCTQHNIGTRFTDANLLSDIEELPHDQFAWVEVPKDGLLWIPYGTPYFLTTLCDVCVCAVWPIFNKLLCQRASSEHWKVYQTALTEFFKTQLAKDCKPWTSYGPAFDAWVQSLSETSA